jgi:hypothetical protein
MNRHNQRGLALVPVAIALAFTGALAWAMVREGAMSVSAVDMDYDAQVARYLAEAGLNLARWQNRHIGCHSAVAFGTASLPGGTVMTNAVNDVAGGISIDVSASTPNGRSARITRSQVPVYDPGNRTTVTAGNARDTYLVKGSILPMGIGSFIELTDDTERGVVMIALPALGDAQLVSAQLKLTQTANRSPAGTQAVYAHRVTTAWDPLTASWLLPWSSPGGDFVAAPDASMNINQQNTTYSMRIDALADAWINKRLPNQGVLLTTSGVQQAQFGRLVSDGPQLVLDYYPRCK